MTNLVAASIVFHNGAIIPVEAAFDYSDVSGYVSPIKVIWDDGSYSYAKGWWGNEQAGFKFQLVEVGAGAYGNMQILKRDNERLGA